MRAGVRDPDEAEDEAYAVTWGKVMKVGEERAGPGVQQIFEDADPEGHY